MGLFLKSRLTISGHKLLVCVCGVHVCVSLSPEPAQGLTHSQPSRNVCWMWNWSPWLEWKHTVTSAITYWDCTIWEAQCQCCRERGLNYKWGRLRSREVRWSAQGSHSPEASQGLCFFLQGHYLYCKHSPFAFVLPILPHSMPASLSPNPLLQLHVRPCGVSPCF